MLVINYALLGWAKKLNKSWKCWWGQYVLDMRAIFRIYVTESQPGLQMVEELGTQRLLIFSKQMSFYQLYIFTLVFFWSLLSSLPSSLSPSLWPSSSDHSQLPSAARCSLPLEPGTRLTFKMKKVNQKYIYINWTSYPGHHLALLSPNIHIQILPTNLNTVSWKVSWELGKMKAFSSWRSFCQFSRLFTSTMYWFCWEKRFKGM